MGGNHNNSLDEDAQGTNKSNSSKKENSSGSDDSSSDSKNLRKASEALNRNVQLHNAKLCKENEINHFNRDDVTGATVTANNADARLSSLQHHASNNNPSKLNLENLEAHSNSSSSNSLLDGVEDNNRQGTPNKRSDGGNDRDETTNGNSSDESGYDEGSDSFPSRGDCSSSDNEDQNSSEVRKPKPLAPTCTVCLVRADLTTIWCEVTASIRTNTPDEDDDEPQAMPSGEKATVNKKNSNNGEGNDNTQESTEPTNSTENEDEAKEVLLCLRPLRDGDKVGEELRFDLQASKNKCKEIKMRNEQLKKLQQQTKAKMILSQQQDSAQKLESDSGLVATTSLNTKPVGDVVTNVSETVSSVNSANSLQSANGKSIKQTKTNLKQKKGLPFKKRASIEVSNGVASCTTKKQKQQHQHKSISLSTSDTEKSVVESLMLMCNKPKK